MKLIFPLCSTFLALPLESDAKWAFQELQHRLRPYEDFLSFQNPQTPHLTLMFWKEVMDIEYKPIVSKAEEIASRSKSFDLPVGGVETFGKHGAERVLFLAPVFSPELATLKKLCPWPNGLDDFHPHITLAHIRHPQRFDVHRKKIMKALEDAKFLLHVDRLRLYAEVDGKQQTALEEFPFMMIA